MTTNEHILSMPLTELRERVELAERMALAARLTPSGTYAEGSAAVNGPSGGSSAAPAAEAPKPRTRRTKEQIAADEAAATDSAAAETGAAGAGDSAMSADDLMASMSPDPATDAGAGELSLDAIGDDDMMAGFESSEATLSPADARQKAEAIVADIIAKKDSARLAVAREALVKVGFQKAGDVTDDKIVEFYNLLPKS